jgi:hypothetical protein
VLPPALRVTPGDAGLRDADGDACRRSDADVRDRTGLTAFEERLSGLFTGEGDPSSSAVSCPLPSLACPLLNWLPIDPTRSAPGRSLGFGARDCRPLVVLAGALFPTPKPPAKEVLGWRAPGRGGGPIDVRLAPTIGLTGLDNVTEGVRALEGVPVLGVEVVEGVADCCFVGDFVGDYQKLDMKELIA